MAARSTGPRLWRWFAAHLTCGSGRAVNQGFRNGLRVPLMGRRVEPAVFRCPEADGRDGPLWVATRSDGSSSGPRVASGRSRPGPRGLLAILNVGFR